MSIRAFIPWPDPRLRTPAAPVAAVTEDIHGIWGDMIKTMDAMPGIGLAAPQIGIMQQLAVVDVSTHRNQRIRIANPVILERSAETQVREEASPNLPGVSAKICRPNAISLRYLDPDGMIVRRDFVGLEATSVQHQIDHLNGRMFFDHLSKTKRDMLLRRARKQRRG
ncbi:MAG: peptide deformylase [Pseudomonadota bacterium]